MTEELREVTEQQEPEAELDAEETGAEETTAEAEPAAEVESERSEESE